VSPPSPDSSAGGPQLLVILRHSEAEPFAAEDHQRQLTERGRCVSVADGEWLATRGIVPTHAFVSSAVRAQETWARVSEGSGSVAEPRIEDTAYTADTDTAVDLLRTAPADARMVIFVGHNPTAASLVHHLDDGDPAPDAFRALARGFPPGALAVLEVAVPWSELGVATGHLAAFHVGRA
jgi:phosphohistidine phosphatase